MYWLILMFKNFCYNWPFIFTSSIIFFGLIKSIPTGSHPLRFFGNFPVYTLITEQMRAVWKHFKEPLSTLVRMLHTADPVCLRALLECSYWILTFCESFFFPFLPNEFAKQIFEKACKPFFLWFLLAFEILNQCLLQDKTVFRINVKEG